jgi:predicted RNA-binding Zn ribbon-like protein
MPGREDLCLDFANTRFWRGTSAPTETLDGPAELFAWLDGAGVLPAIDHGALPRTAAGEKAALFADCIALREVIYRIFAAAAAGDAASEADLASLNEALAAAPPRVRLARSGASYGWVAARPATSSAPALLAPVLWSAADLLTGLHRVRLRRCANDACLWLFIDQSKGGTRRWCDMSACGNRAKARRHYQRVRPGAKETG